MSGRVYQDETHPNVIVLKMWPGVTWDEVDDMFEAQKALVGQTREPVAVVLDVSDTPTPPGTGTLSRSRGYFTGQPGNIALWVLLGGNRLSDMLASVVRNAQISRMATACSMDEAYAAIDSEFARLGQEVSV